jgi:hypothetical protein
LFASTPPQTRRRTMSHEVLMERPLRIVWGDLPSHDQERDADVLIADDGLVTKHRYRRVGMTIERGHLARLAIGDTLVLDKVLDALDMGPGVKVILERAAVMPARSRTVGTVRLHHRGWITLLDLRGEVVGTKEVDWEVELAVDGDGRPYELSGISYPERETRG